MPGWHEATRGLLEEGKLQVAGIVQEQHPDRCRLFMQWKAMDWPVMVDSLNLLEVSAVPITLLIDERGVVRRRVSPRAAPHRALAEFVAAEPVEARAAPPRARPDPGGVDSGRELALWGGQAHLDRAVAAYSRAVAADPASGRDHFRLGVVYRMRYDSAAGKADDFDRAVEHWGEALRIDPNNYIWRRRIQQYGPRLDKPYPFYDWVEQARREIAERGEKPLPLIVEPRGAELAHPARSFESALPVEGPPDPGGRILRDAGEMIQVQAVTVPRTLRPGGSARVHLEFRPRPETDAHWNNEASGLLVWVDPPEGWQVDRQRIELPNPAEPASAESRRVELEVRSPEGASTTELSGYALYYVCRGPRGACLYRRQDFPVTMRIEPRAAHDFAFEDVNPASPTRGERLRLSQLRAKRGVVLNFLASWCTYCWEELPHLQELHAAGEARVVGIAADEYGAPLSVVLGLVEKAGLTMPILFVPQDEAAKLERHYDHQMLPATYVIDRRGGIRRTIQGAKPWEELREAILHGLR